MTKRDTAIQLAKVAGYHNDTARYTRLIVESRVARSFMVEAWRNGVAAKNAGVKCSCYDCKQPIS